MEENIVKKASKSKRKMKKRSKDSEGWIDSLPWNDANPADCSTVLLGSNEGGFLFLEEIDEDVYNLGQPQNVETLKDLRKSKKRKRAVGKDDKERANESTLTQEDDLTEGLGLTDTAVSSKEEDDKTQKKRKRNKKKKKMKRKKSESKTDKDADNYSEQGHDVDMTDMNIPNAPKDASVKVHEDDLSFGVEEISEWKELRLHPLLEKAIWSLRFKEPTPIQKMCIPAAAHQGKDLIGAAETGSGKTLAFGLPILQRLLEEQDKEARKKGLTIEEERSSKGKKGGSPLRALVVTPTRELALQVCDHLKAAAKFTNIRIIPVVGGIAMQKQERFLKQKPHIIVGTPGRLWELMAGGERHLVELYSLSFFVLDEADRMIEKGHFHELQSIIDMLPPVQLPSWKSENLGSVHPLENDLRSNFIQENMSKNNEVNSNCQRKRRQTFIFSATIALTAGFRKKLKKGSHVLKGGTMNGYHSLAILSERAGVRENAAIVDLTSASIVAHKLEESVIECREQDKDAYLYYILKVHGCGRTIVFCTSIAALRRVSAILRILRVTAWPLHAQMQQRSRLKAMDHFRGNENCVLVATDVAARGLDIPGVRTIIHYQLPHSAEVYVHRSGRTARASSDGCSIVLASPSDKSKFISLCNAFSKEGLPQFPVNSSYMPEIEKRVSIAIQIDRVSRKNSQTKAERSWLTRNAEILEMDLEENESDKEELMSSKPKKAELLCMKQLQQELDQLLQQPLQPKFLSHRFIAAAGMSTLLQQQLQEFTSAKRTDSEHRMPIGSKKQRLLVIGEETMEPLAALRNSTK